MNPPATLPPQRRRPTNVPSQTPPPSSPSNSTFNSSLLSTPSSSASPNKTQQMVMTAMETRETALEQVLRNFSRPSLPTPIFPVFHTSPDPKEYVKSTINRANCQTCLVVLENIRENVEASRTTQKKYLKALQSLLLDACEHESAGGLNDQVVGVIYSTLIAVSRLEWEMGVRLQVVEELIGKVGAMEEESGVDVDQPIAEDVLTEENLGEIFRVRFEELIGDRSGGEKLKRNRDWKRLVGTRGIDTGPDPVNGASESGNDVSNEEFDSMADVSMDSDGDTQESKKTLTCV